ncbi:T9SS type A sorting domain-containing protein [Larkinella humicola]|uniref:T9SS type A sorting domain-containing protein n=1 Tax=Larkinella humicola TaxID=2607654 RepID=A0A5N1JE81_9BACT|nr:T9SS type A sorting domain-containing protein [Larkinella humicola]
MIHTFYQKTFLSRLLPKPSASRSGLTRLYPFCSLALVSFLPSKLLAQTPFTCGSSGYQVSAPGGGSNSTLYAYEMSTGVRTTIAALTRNINAIGYNTLDNLIWGYDTNSHEVVRIDATGAVSAFTIPNLPAAAFNTGDIIGNGYLILYQGNGSGYFVVDINPARPATYLQVVNPTTGFNLFSVSPYGIPTAAIPVSDWAYKPADGLLYGLANTSALLTTLNPVTGAITTAATPVTGGGIEADAPGGFGAAFIDNAGDLYVFANGSGKFYKIDVSANTATLLSSSTPSGFNDGARCSSAAPVTSAPTPVPFSCTGNYYQVAAGSGGAASTLYQYDVVTGTRTDVATLDRNVNAIGYNTVDNLLWGYAPNSNEIVRIDAAGTVTAFTVPNLPGYSYNVGDVVGDGYLFLYQGNTDAYTVVDINPARPATYLQVVKPTAGYTLATSAPFVTGIPITPLTDWSYSSADGLLHAIVNGSRFLMTLNPATGATTTSAVAVTGGGIESETGFGASFLDSEGNLYVFSNSSGKFFRINPTTNTATYLSTSIPSGFNDGARCNLAAAPLPVSLISFSVKPLSPVTVEVNWMTASETNNKMYVVERSIDLRKFEKVTQVEDVAGTTPGEHRSKYRIVDQAPYRGTSYYRLTQVDIDGKTTRFPIRSVILDRTYGVFPNPVESSTFTLQLDEPQTATITLKTVDGRNLSFTKSVTNENALIHASLASGVYVIQVTERGQTRVHRVVVK